MEDDERKALLLATAEAVTASKLLSALVIRLADKGLLDKDDLRVIFDQTLLAFEATPQDDPFRELAWREARRQLDQQMAAAFRRSSRSSG